MNQKEFEGWKAVTESSAYRWVEDSIFRLNGRGAMYYTGGEDGIYMKISKDGILELGDYEGALPHIGEATFTVKVSLSIKNPQKCRRKFPTLKIKISVHNARISTDIFVRHRDQYAGMYSAKISTQPGGKN
jgi:hypothetical protein